MKELNKNEMLKVNAGAVSGGVIAAICIGVSFIVGIFDGYVRPFKCR